MTSPEGTLARPQPMAGRLIAPASLLALGLVLGLVGPFGSYVAMGLPVRLLHFATNVILIGGLCAAASLAAKRVLRLQAFPLWLAIAIALAMAPPGAMIVEAGLRFWAPWVLPHVTFGELMQQTLVINLLFGAVAWGVGRHRSGNVRVELHSAPPAAEAMPAEPVPSGADAFMARLPRPLRHARLVALSAEDHYLRVHTDRGDALILMSLSQAVEMLGPRAGVRIHRSHWAAFEAIDRRARTAGRATLIIEGGLELPISRSGRRLLADPD
jgi:LytTr DNA-binding domain